MKADVMQISYLTRAFYENGWLDSEPEEEECLIK